MLALKQARRGRCCWACSAHDTEQVARFVALLKDGPLGAREAMDALGLRHRPTFLANYLQPALKAGLVEMTQPESPKSPTQKYRVVNTA